MKPTRIRRFYVWLGIGVVADAIAAVLGFFWRRYAQLANAVLLGSGWWPTSLHLGVVSVVRTWGGYFLDYGGAAYNAKHPAFGAVGDGVNDDTTPCQSCITQAINTSAMKKAVLPGPIHKITAALTIPDLGGNRKYHAIIEGAGAPDLLYDGNPDPTEVGGTVLSFTPTTGAHCLAFTLSGVTSGLPAITIRNLGIRHATESTSSGDGLRFVGDNANARTIRVALDNVAVRGFKGGSGLHMEFCQNGSGRNVTVCRNKYGATVRDASNANAFFQFVAQYNTDNGLRLLNIVCFHMFGGLIQANPKNGVYGEGAEEVSLNGVHFESNNTTAPNTFYALHIKGSNGKFNSFWKIDTCRFADATYDKIYIEGHASGTTAYITFIGSRSMVATNSVTIADGNCYYVMFLTPLGGTITDNGNGTIMFENGWIEMKEQADPAAPGANKVRLYAKDSGAGKTQLAARFPTGAVQVPAVEP